MSVIRAGPVRAANPPDRKGGVADEQAFERRLDSCTPTSETLATSVTYTGPRGVTIAGLGIRVEYPVQQVVAPAFSASPGVGNVTNDDGHGFVAEPIKIGGLPKPFMRATYRTCKGARAATPHDFKCTVSDASDDHGNVVDPGGLSCAVTVP